MAPSMRPALAIAAIILGACGVPVDVGALDGGVGSTTGRPDASSTGASGSSSGMVASGSSESGEITAPRHLAIRVADLPSGGGTGTGSSAGSSAGGDATAGDTNDDPDALQLISGNYAVACDDPYGGMPGCNAWQLGFRLPPELQQVGATGSVFDHYGAFSETTGGVGECGFGGGSLEGSFEITAIDADHVAGRLTGLVGPTGFVTLEFDAPRCP